MTDKFYWLFAENSYYPVGGTDDLQGIYSSLEDAKAHIVHTPAIFNPRITNPNKRVEERSAHLSVVESDETFDYAYVVEVSGGGARQCQIAHITAVSGVWEDKRTPD